MTKILLSGCNGRLGRSIVEAAALDGTIEIAAGVDINPEKRGDFPVYADIFEYPGSVDLVVDCSHPSALHGLITWCLSKNCGLIVATTGHTPEQLEELRAASASIPVFRSANMSLGVALLTELSRRAAQLLGSAYDIEIIEKHHNRKLDAPSGTALALADAISAALPYEPEYVYDRQSVRRPRSKTEIGISSVRGGTIVGEHTVLFAGLDETIELTHRAQSRAVFAGGVIKAVAFLNGAQPGYYDMPKLVDSLLD